MITQRIRQIMEAYDLNARSFADRVGVQRSGMSHLFSGRNKPSLDLIMKILDSFHEVSADWLLFGTGELSVQKETNVNILRDDKCNQIGPEKPQVPSELSQVDTHIKETKSVSGSASVSGTEINADEPDSGIDQQNPATDVTDPERIVFFHADGTFKSYKNRC